jgi:hypothetical protein
LPATALLLASFIVYRAIIAAIPKRGALAHAQAAGIIALEKRVGIFIEPRLRWWAFHHAGLPVLGALDGRAVYGIVIQVYAVGQLPWLAAVLFWLYLFHKDRFNRVAGLAVLGTLLGVAIAAVYPVAPPRFTIFSSQYSAVYMLNVPSSERIMAAHLTWNPYAAFPSLHVYWSLVTGYALVLGSPGRVYRCLAAFLPILMVFTVIVTANHHVIDCMGSLGLFLIARSIQILLERLLLRVRPAADEGSIRIERRVTASTRALDAPLVFAATLGMLQVISQDHFQQVTGALTLMGGALMLFIARNRVARGFSLAAQVPLADWWAGALFIAGTTMIGTTLGANAADRRHVASLLWLVAVGLPLLGRLNLNWGEIRQVVRTMVLRIGEYRALVPPQRSAVPVHFQPISVGASGRLHPAPIGASGHLDGSGRLVHGERS